MKNVTRGFTVVLAAIGLIGSATLLRAEEKNWEELDQASKRAKIDETADKTKDDVLAGSNKANDLYGKAYGWAAFDNLKIAFGFSGGGGNGVAVNKKTGQRTYMKMGTAGVGLGLGAKGYQVLFLFQDEQTFNSFVEKGWQADASASAQAGGEGVGAQTGFVNGIAVYQISDKGLMAAADVAGTKYWKNDKLNE
ncbi:MAG TPA: YSC84-related protein [Thermoanaerobaculales bacterium]|nr:YSC84-related protein [Thermoanaerobaculales bacterium]HQN96199.1 YSC84-related protein [Thermoanaerobaculales bacterium]